MERESSRAETLDSGMEQRLRNAEAAIDTLRATTSGLEREIALMRADLERLRQECERAAGSKLP
jgi:multidrug resistance efflux pump